MREEEERVSLQLISKFKMPPERIKTLSDKKDVTRYKRCSV